MTQPTQYDPTCSPVGSWAFSPVHGESVRILDVETVWNHTVYQVWIPQKGTVERVPAESLTPTQPTRASSLDRITYAVAAARIADALTQDMLLAPLEAGVIPLPHQLYALTRAVTGDRVRYLLADEVGLGKTIEAGLIFRELKLRGLVKRVLVVAPKGLVAQWVQEMQTHYGETVLDPALAQQLSSHPLPFWVERMATAYLRSEGGTVQRDLFSYSLEWPDGSRMERVSFQSRVAQDRGLQHVSLEDARIRRLVQQLPRVVVTEPIPSVRFASLPAEVVGYWSLWRIALDNQSLRDVKIIPIFHHDDRRNLGPTARHIWDALMEDRPEVEQVGTKGGAEVEAVFRRLRAEAERLGEDAFHDLYSRHQRRLKREQEKGQYAFQVRREALSRLGLPEVRQHRLKRLDDEERAWAAELRKREQILPELQPIILLRVEAGNG